MRETVEGRPLDEHDLIERSMNGDAQAFESLVRAHQGMALRIAYLVVRDHSEAEDVTQDAFIKAHRALGRFRRDSPFRPWLLAIVRNEALNRVRSSKRRERLVLREGSDPVSRDAAPSPETVVVSDAERARVLDAIDRLSERHRAVITSRFLLELSEEETAQMLGIPAGTVKSRTSRAMDHLRAILEETET
ncbi:MAG TPA: RNA polymerase sigma factor [Acidimicrobiia bacterium]|jgi:RNA polymerase sigma-70 factor (ECF subfamily)|nr:RNA polymerase sigma factor [Acidimicrobiia bacterium]